MTKRHLKGLLFLLLILLLGCKKDATVWESHTPFIDGQTSEWVDSLLSELSLEQKIGQLLIWKPQQVDTTAFLEAIRLEMVSGFQLQELKLVQYLTLVSILNSQTTLPLFWVSDAKVLLNEHFQDTPYGPELAPVNASDNDSLWNHLNDLLVKQAKALQINWVIGNISPGNTFEGDQLYASRLQKLKTAQILSYSPQFQAYYPNYADNLIYYKNLVKPYQKIVEQGLGVFQLDPMGLQEPASENTVLNSFFSDMLDFDGLISLEVQSPEQSVLALNKGVDLLRISTIPAAHHRAIQNAIATGVLSEDQLDQKLRKVLMAKKWIYNGFNQASTPAVYRPIQAALKDQSAPLTSLPSIEAIYSHFIDSDWSYFNWEIQQQAQTVLSNPAELLPLDGLNQKTFRVLSLGENRFSTFRKQFEKYADARWLRSQRKTDGSFNVIINGRGSYFNVLLLENEIPNPKKDSIFWKGLLTANEKKRLVIINFGPATNLRDFDKNFTIIQAYKQSTAVQSLAAQLLFGGVSAQGKLPAGILPNWRTGTQHMLPQTRLAFAPAQAVGIRPEKLVGIHAIANSAIRRKATPGCQVFVAKQGKVIFSKSFGYHTYRKRHPVKETDLFDVASVTKVAATSLQAMKSYQEGQFRLNDPIKKLLPEYKDAGFDNTRIKDVFIHRSGIQPHLPVLPYLLYRKEGNTACDSFFCKTPDSIYSIAVADSFYFKNNYRDSIWEDIKDVKVSNRRRYRYSDVNFVLIQRLLETKHQQSLDQMAKKHFYQPLGLRHTLFKPLEKFDLKEIMPTERDKKWRKQQIHGFVHDETAALFGGVAGHAGLFSNAEDLGVIFQMLLNKGKYGNQKLLNPETIDLFTQSGHGNHRGLGFDKLHSSNRSGRAYEMGSDAFGHTGFTGTCVWVDPDQDLVYVFLSNRVFPDARNRKLFKDNVRSRIHQVVYDAMDSYTPQWPDLVY